MEEWMKKRENEGIVGEGEREGIMDRSGGRKREIEDSSWRRRRVVEMSGGIEMGWRRVVREVEKGEEVERKQ